MTEQGAGAPSVRLRARRRPRLRTILLLVNLSILMLPLGGIAVLHLYENELIRSTEAQLITQGAHVREAFRAAYLREARELASPADRALGGTPIGRPLPPGWRPQIASPEAPDAIVPHLDISEETVRSPEPDATPPRHDPDPIAVRAGDEMTAALQAAGRVTLSGIRVVDTQGVVVATTRTEMGLSILAREEVRRALEGESLSLIRARTTEESRPPLASISRGQRYRVVVALPVIESGGLLGAVVLSRTPMDIQKALYLSRHALLIGAGSLLAVAILVSSLTAFTIVNPVRRLIAQADRAARGEKGAVVEIQGPGTREIGQLSESLAVMARTLEERADYIRTFASHVSHEFKTPLTAIRGTVELLEEHVDSMSAEERGRFLSIVADAGGRLERLVHRLLELARADVLRPGAASTEIGPAIEAVARRFRDVDVQVDVRNDPRVVAVRMSEDVLGEILSNLLENARQHGGSSVHAQILTCLAGASGKGPHGAFVEVRVSDDGPGVSDANSLKIFTPFFTTARERGGSGLGLSIVRSLLEAHGGSIALDKVGEGAAFVILIPSAGRE